jgi:hypothetical protein
VTRKIKNLVSHLKKTFLQGGLEKASHRQGDVVERRRDIFYDTDGILERQRELIRVCSNCAGAVGLESTASTGNHVFAVQIPADACPGCRETAESWYAQACSGPFDHVMLRDRDRRTFHRTGPTKE